jgi:hypothetical protein
MHRVLAEGAPHGRRLRISAVHLQPRESVVDAALGHKCLGVCCYCV